MKMFCRKANRDQAGFSLLELMIIIGITGIIATIAIPAFINWLPKIRLRSSARDLYSTMQKAKIEAIKRNANVAVIFNVAVCGTLPPSPIPAARGSYTVFVDDGSGGGVAGDSTQNGTEEVIKNGTLPEGVALCNATFGATAPPTASFKPEGLPMNQGSADLYNTEKKHKITITSAGAIRLQ